MSPCINCQCNKCISSLFREGEAARLAHDYEKALSIFHACLMETTSEKSAIRVTDRITLCLVDMGRLDEAMTSIRLQLDFTELSTSERADVYSNYAQLLIMLRQFDEAAKYYRHTADLDFASGDMERTKVSETSWKIAMEAAAKSDWTCSHTTNKFRMCNACGRVAKDLCVCSCKKAWYCDETCQLHDWKERHCSKCDACSVCEKVCETVFWCSGCKGVKYCGTKCQMIDWYSGGHKKSCK